MGFLDALKRLVSGAQKAPVLWLRVRCDRCGEIIESRVNLYNDLSLQDSEGKAAYQFTRTESG